MWENENVLVRSTTNVTKTGKNKQSFRVHTYTHIHKHTLYITIHTQIHRFYHGVCRVCGLIEL